MNAPVVKWKCVYWYQVRSGDLLTAVRAEHCPYTAKSQDHSRPTEVPEIAAARFDEEMEAWVLTRYADVAAAYRSSRLVLTGIDKRKPVTQHDVHAHRTMRTETLDALSPAQLRQWRELLAPQAETLVRKLNAAEPIDLLEDYGRPLCLFVAAMVTNISLEEAQHLSSHAREVTAAAAEPNDLDLKARAKAAGVALRSHFSSGPEALRESGFVALSQTMPCLLGNAWAALSQHPDQWRLLHEQPTLIDQAMEELLRYAGLTTMVFRVATEDIHLNGLHLPKGTRLVLKIIAGNHDEASFEHPEELDITRRASGHLSLGMGAHACVGANLIRMVMKQLTLPLVIRFKESAIAEPIEWIGGSGFRSPGALFVRLLPA